MNNKLIFGFDALNSVQKKIGLNQLLHLKHLNECHKNSHTYILRCQQQFRSSLRIRNKCLNIDFICDI